jgi:L-asparaginase
MMLSLAGFVRELEEHTDGIVITHGTDSMEESAYFLDLVMGDKIPIVFTGSMHTLTDAAWDGGRNLVDAFAVAASGAFQNMGTLVVMNGHIHAASEVTKTHTMKDDTFRSPDFGPLGTVNTFEFDEPRRIREPHYRMNIAMDGDAELPYVELIKTYSGMGDTLFIAALKAGAAGIVIEAMGQGNVPPGVVNGISRAREMNIPVIITTRCQAGPVRPYYTYEGAGRELERLGCIFAPYLTGPKARIKLMLALAAGMEGDALKGSWNN